MHKSLFICNVEDELRWIKEYNIDNCCIGTINYSFYAKCKKEGKEIIFFDLEKAVPYKTINNLIDEINVIIEECVKKEYLYTFSNHPIWELSRHLASILLYIDYFIELRRLKEIDTIYTVDNKANWVINEAIFLVMQNERENYVILDENSGKRKECLYTLKDSYYDTEKRKKSLRENLQVDDFFRYWKRFRKKKKVSKNEFTIGVMHEFKKMGRHADWRINFAKVLSKHFEVNLINLYHIEENVEFANDGISVDYVEDYFNRIDFFLAYAGYIKDIMHIEKELKRKLRFLYKEINMQHYLYQKVMNRLRRECLERIYIDSCIKEYFKYNKYKFIYTATGTFNSEGRMMYYNTRKHNTKLFQYIQTSVCDYPVNDVHADEVAIRIFTNDKMKANRMQNIEYSGALYYAPEEFIYESHYKKVSEKRFHKKISILFTPAEPCVGFVSTKRYFEVCHEVLNALQKEKCEVIVKNHPNIDKAVEAEVIKEYSGVKNVKFVPADASLSEAMEECDCVIASNLSTVLLDATLAQRPVFGIKYQENHGIVEIIQDGFKIYDKVCELCDDIIAVINDKESAKAKFDDMVKRQNAYINELKGCGEGSFEQHIYKILSTELKQFNENSIGIGE